MQRHETFKTQWRAMFVMNCAVDPRPITGGTEEGASGEGDEVVAVRCATCGASVGVRDEDEV